MAPKIETWSIRVTNPDLMEQPKDHPLNEWQKYDAALNEGTPLAIPRIGQFFLQGMMNRMGVSYHKYGSFLETFPHKRVGVENALHRIDHYHKTGNIEELMDAANYLLIEFVRPSSEDCYYRPTDSDASPGAKNVDGTISHGKVDE